ncbi:MAG: hypothetical protein AAF581_08950 [Planctomycetota bacterium]
MFRLPPRRPVTILVTIVLLTCGLVVADDWCSSPSSSGGGSQQGDEGEFGIYQCFEDSGWVETARLNVQKLGDDQYLEWWAYKRADGANGLGFAHLNDGAGQAMDIRFQYLGEGKTDFNAFESSLPWQWNRSYEIFQCVSIKRADHLCNCGDPDVTDAESLCVSGESEWGTGLFDIAECFGDSSSWANVARVNVQEITEDEQYRFWWAYKTDPGSAMATSKMPIQTSIHYYVRPSMNDPQATLRFNYIGAAETRLDDFQRSLPWDASVFECVLTKLVTSP